MSESLKKKIRSIPDFPKKGIVFRDITTLLKDQAAFQESISLFVERYRKRSIDLVCAIEARGYIFGGALAYQLDCGFVPIRKPGKLPSKTISEEYVLEYGTGRLEIHADGITRGKRVLLVDDLLATGGTLAAACRLIERLGGRVAEIAVVIELAFLHGRKNLSGYEVFSLVTYESEM